MKKSRVKNYLVLAGLVLLLSACKKQVTWQEQYDLGMKYLGEGSYQEAVTAFQQAIALDANQQSVYIGTADAYVGLAQRGDEGLNIAKCCDTAEQNYQKALEFDDSTEEIYTKLADVYLLSGDMEKAQEILDTGKAKVSSSDGKLDEKMQQVLDEIAKNMPNISEYQEQGYVLETLKEIPESTGKFGILAIREGTDDACLLAVADVSGTVYASYEYKGLPKSEIEFLNEKTIYYPTKDGYVLKSIDTGEDVATDYVKEGEKIIDVYKFLSGEVCMVTQAAIGAGRNRVSIYDENGTCMFSCVDKDLEEKAIGTSMEGIKCNWDFDQIYYYENYKGNARGKGTVFYCNDIYSLYIQHDRNNKKGRYAVCVGHAVLLPDIQNAFIVPTEITIRRDDSWLGVNWSSDLVTNGEIVLYKNHRLDISNGEFDMNTDYIPNVTDEDELCFVNPDVIEIQKADKNDGDFYHYLVDGEKIQLLDEKDRYKFWYRFYDDLSLVRIYDENKNAHLVLVDENGNQVLDTNVGEIDYISEYFSRNQCWLVKLNDEREILVDRKGNVLQVDDTQEKPDEEGFSEELRNKRDLEIYGQGQLFVEESDHIYNVYIYDNKIWPIQLK